MFQLQIKIDNSKRETEKRHEFTNIVKLKRLE